MKFPFLEIMLHKIRDEKFLKITKMEFCGTAIAKKGNDRHSRRKSRDLIRLDSIRFDGSTRLESSRVYIFYNFNSTRLDSI